MVDDGNGNDLLVPSGGEPRFQLGGPMYRLARRIGLVNDDGAYLVRRIVAFVIIAWLPLFVLSTLHGNALGPTPREAFLFDFVSYARFFVAVPLIFAAEVVVGPRLRAAGLRFLTSGIVRPEDRPGFDAAITRVARRREAIAPETLLGVIAFAGPWFLSLDAVTGVNTATWRATFVDGRIHLTSAGVWYYFVAIPLVQFLMWRWLWRLIIWGMFLWDMSRLKLNLLATHADRAGGLGFLGLSHVSLAIFPFALGCVLSSEIAFRAVFEGLDFTALKNMAPLLIAYLVLVEGLTFGPLLIFVPLLVRVRREALGAYGMLVQRHNAQFHRKWIEEERQEDEAPLGNPDMSSLVDLGSSFDVIREMGVLPVSRNQMLQVAAVTCVPGLPLIFLVLPFADVLRLIAGVLR